MRVTVFLMIPPLFLLLNRFAQQLRCQTGLNKTICQIDLKRPTCRVGMKSFSPPKMKPFAIQRVGLSRDRSEAGEICSRLAIGVS